MKKMLAFLVAASPIDMLHVTRQALSTMLNRRAALSSEMAIRCEKVFGIDAATMIRMQAVWNIARAGATADSIIVERRLTAA